MLHVVCALIQRQGSDRVLGVQRPLNKVRGGYWEFPGGKVHQQETSIQAIQREIREELQIELQEIEAFVTVEHTYNDLEIRLESFICKIDTNCEPVPIEHMALEWVEMKDARHLKWSEADLKILDYYQINHEDSSVQF